MRDGEVGASKTREPSPARRRSVDAAREGWIRRLIDLSRRNNLLYFRDLRTGTLDLGAASEKAMLPFLQGQSVGLADFVGAEEEKTAAAKIREIRHRAVSNLEERGLETLYVAMGMATWNAADGGRPAEAAVLLIPTEVEPRGREGRSFSLRRKGELQVNLVLTHFLEAEFGAAITAEDLIDVLQGDDEGEAFDPTPAYERLSAAARDVAGFAVKPRLVLGNFAYQKTAMVRDLREFGDEMACHDLIAALAGDTEARAAVQARRQPVDPTTLDQAPPDAEFLVLDADSSQQRVIRQALGEQDGVVHGPPGTGKSQTIANLIAEFAAQGRRVLFVAEKRAALEVVLARLQAAGLGHLALDLHGAEVSRRELMGRFAESLGIVRSTPPVEVDKLHSKFAQRRRRLIEHSQLVHAEQAPSGTSVYAMQGQLLNLEREVGSVTRWRDAALMRLDRSQVDAIRDLLDEAVGFEGLFLRTDPSPWTGARLTDGRAVEAAMDSAQALLQAWTALLAAWEALRAESGLKAPPSLAVVRHQLELLAEVAQTLEKYSADLFTSEDLEGLVGTLEPARAGAIERIWAFVAKGDYRQGLRRGRAVRIAGRAHPRELLAEIAAANEQARRWAAMSDAGGTPHATPSLGRAQAAVRAFTECLDRLFAVLVADDRERIELAALGDWVNALARDRATPPRLPRLNEIERELDERGAGALVAELREHRPPLRKSADIFEHAWLASCLDAARAEHAELAAFNGRTHDKLVAEFRQLDEDRIGMASSRVRRSHAERVVEVMNAHPEQEALIRRESVRKARFTPFRRLVREAADVLTALRPCWMASPLSVSHLLPAERALFDVILFDEASQVLPEDAVPALLRGRNAIVAGDRLQLPPTTFFVAGDDGEDEVEEAAVTQGFESILDLMSGLLGDWPLEWHYRSRDESLIAFSNRHIYGDRLVTFPAPSREHAVSHVLVRQTAPQDGQEDSSSPEVSRVVELVLEHAQDRPAESLGVIALGIQHARRLEAAIEEALKLRPELDAFFDQSRRERFFVKNLERVQGDERDSIILSVGYGKDRAGKLPYRFGPLLMEGGERRLNVAITRARRRMTVVSSFTHHDMDPGRSKARGVELLRRYLEYSLSAGARLGEDGETRFPPNAFECDVRDALTQKGMQLLEQWGASRYRIDLVAQHPQAPGRFVLAIECDGATYHDTPTARDRDRLRQQHLGKLGWHLHRIWSTDWFSRRDDEIERALRAYEAAVRAADGEVSPAGSERGGAGSAGSSSIVVAPKRARRPAVGQRPSITDYSEDELGTLVAWIQSDACLRTDDEILEEAISELGFDRRGSRITAAIRGAIERWRQR